MPSYESCWDDRNNADGDPTTLQKDASIYFRVSGGSGEPDGADLLNMAFELVRPDRSSGLRCSLCPSSWSQRHRNELLLPRLYVRRM